MLQSIHCGRCTLVHEEKFNGFMPCAEFQKTTEWSRFNLQKKTEWSRTVSGSSKEKFPYRIWIFGRKPNGPLPCLDFERMVPNGAISKSTSSVRYIVARGASRSAEGHPRSSVKVADGGRGGGNWTTLTAADERRPASRRSTVSPTKQRTDSV